jgi:hypothetical protein
MLREEEKNLGSSKALFQGKDEVVPGLNEVPRHEYV